MTTFCPQHTPRFYPPHATSYTSCYLPLEQDFTPGQEEKKGRTAGELYPPPHRHSPYTPAFVGGVRPTSFLRPALGSPSTTPVSILRRRRNTISTAGFTSGYYKTCTLHCMVMLQLCTITAYLLGLDSSSGLLPFPSCGSVIPKLPVYMILLFPRHVLCWAFYYLPVPTLPACWLFPF